MSFDNKVLVSPLEPSQILGVFIEGGSSAEVVTGVSFLANMSPSEEWGGKTASPTRARNAAFLHPEKRLYNKE